MKLSRKNQLSPEKRAELRNLIYASVRKADYASAMSAAEEARKSFPQDFAVWSDNASILGDYAEVCPPRIAKRLRAKSIDMMRSLLQRTRVEYDMQVINNLKNEYYWQTKNRIAQYQLGLRNTREGDDKGYYSQGVGAAWHALELAQKGRSPQAIRWAKRSVKAWKAYEKKRPDYYNQYVHRALAEGVLGIEGAMETSLRRAATLAGKDIDFAEFQEIRSLVTKLRMR